MAEENNYKGINHIVKISTHIGTGCEHCSHAVGNDNFTESVNHYIKEHGYKLLHVGSENGDNLTMTVAILGK